MFPSAIVPTLDILEGGQPSRGPRRKVSMIDHLALEGLEKTLGNRIIPTVAFATASAARSYFAQRVSLSIHLGTPYRHTEYRNDGPARSE